MDKTRAGAVLGVLLALAVAAPAAGRSLRIIDFTAAIEITPDAVIQVTERITARFEGEWNGLYRTIPVEYRTPRGLAFDLRLVAPRAMDTDGNSLRLESGRDRHYRKLKIWVPGAADATRTVVLRYEVRNALRFFDEHDELYWNVTGDEWDVPIEHATARITLPAEVTNLRAAAYTGAYGSRASEAEVRTDTRAVDVWLRRPLGFHEGLTVVVGWGKGVVDPPGPVARLVDVVRANWPLGAPFGALGLMAWLWSKRGRDPQLGPIAVRYEPPDGLSPAEVGTLADERADVRDVTATLVDLAVRGHLSIEEKAESRLLGLLSGTDYVLRRPTPRPPANDLKPHEHAVLGGVFSATADAVELSDLENRFYRHLSAIRAGVFNALVERGFYTERPDAVRTRWMVAAFVLVMLAGAGAVVGPAALDATPLALALGGFGTAVVVGIFGWLMPARTIAGTRALEAVRGFAEFLSRVEGDRLDRIARTPELFEKYLPFAMALGVERQWARAFEGICREPPRWYQGNGVGDFRPRLFADRMAVMSQAAATTMTSQPRSTGSGSGFGGGGSSGGGGGGGGGGGF